MPYHDISPTVRISYNVHPASPSAPRAKPWVILINGLADPQVTWAAQVPAFTATGYTVLTYDNRGIGLSSRPTGEELYTAADMASDLRSLILALDVPTPYHVLGVSMGGMIAQTYALTYGLAHPGEILSLTPACTYSAPGPFCSRMFSLWADMARRMSVADVMRDVALWCFTPAFFADPATQAELAAMEAEMARTDVDMGLNAYLAQLNVITTFDTTAVVGQLASHMTVLVVAGEVDVLIPTTLSRELHRLVPGSQWRTTPGGHACMWEFADEFNKVCLEGWKGAEEKQIA